MQNLATIFILITILFNLNAIAAEEKQPTLPGSQHNEGQIAKIKEQVERGEELTLVLGAGNRNYFTDNGPVNDADRFSEGYVVLTNNSERTQIDTDGSLFLVADFNNSQFLAHLAHEDRLAGAFSHIIMDVSVAKFSSFNLEHLQSLAGLLKSGGTFTMDLSCGSGVMAPFIHNGETYCSINDWNFTLKSYENELEEYLRSEKARDLLKFATPVNLYKPGAQNTCHLNVATVKELNQDLLERAGFSKIDWFEKEDLPVPPHPQGWHLKQRIFFVATK